MQDNDVEKEMLVVWIGGLDSLPCYLSRRLANPSEACHLPERCLAVLRLE